ncbi:hypothetical protein GWI33_019370 [Rhynchophorus ferrugineus]|uniref:Uncharacterized protein n=1 Tax=Rhynchophorus ferrugineus TaxID=354439 RepID=A0A834M5B9_RHYFE|nr:hypothetical protein GWI33_019370 [Rhynchophorus ferrugineus]
MGQCHSKQTYTGFIKCDQTFLCFQATTNTSTLKIGKARELVPYGSGHTDSSYRTNKKVNTHKEQTNIPTSGRSYQETGR